MLPSPRNPIAALSYVIWIVIFCLPGCRPAPTPITTVAMTIKSVDFQNAGGGSSSRVLVVITKSDDSKTGFYSYSEDLHHYTFRPGATYDIGHKNGYLYSVVERK